MSVIFFFPRHDSCRPTHPSGRENLSRCLGTHRQRRTSRAAAGSYWRRERRWRWPELEATALVHEAYLRLVPNDREAHWDSRSHFFAACAEAMRRILVEKARPKQRLRHGGDH